MCTPTIIDSNSVSLVVHGGTAATKPDPILKWLEDGFGVLCYTGAGKLGQEIGRTKGFKQKLQAYRESGRARYISGHKMKTAKNQLEVERLRSDDEDLLALILASNAEIVATDDKDLRKDIKDYIKGVKRVTVAIYPRYEKRKIRQKFLDRRRCVCR